MEQLLEQIAAAAGWDKDEQIAVLMEYIENQQSDAAFVDHLNECLASSLAFKE